MPRDNQDLCTICRGQLICDPDSGNSTQMIHAHGVEYSFGVEGRMIAGRAMIFTRNYTAGDAGIWTGFIVGVESSECNLDATL